MECYIPFEQIIFVQTKSTQAFLTPFYVPKQIYTLQRRYSLRLEADLKLRSARSSLHDCLSLQVDVKSSITYCTPDEFTALLVFSGQSGCVHSGASVHRFALVCCRFLLCGGHVRLDSSRRREAPPVLFSPSLTLNQLYGSVKAARSTLTPCPVLLPPPPPPQPSTVAHHSVVGMLLTWLSWPDPDAFSELRFSSLLMMSAHVFLYWCRSSEYTKGSQAALLYVKHLETIPQWGLIGTAGNNSTILQGSVNRGC